MDLSGIDMVLGKGETGLKTRNGVVQAQDSEAPREERFGSAGGGLVGWAVRFGFFDDAGARFWSGVTKRS